MRPYILNPLYSGDKHVLLSILERFKVCRRRPSSSSVVVVRRRRPSVPIEFPRKYISFIINSYVQQAAAY